MSQTTRTSCRSTNRSTLDSLEPTVTRSSKHTAATPKDRPTLTAANLAKNNSAHASASRRHDVIARVQEVVDAASFLDFEFPRKTKSQLLEDQLEAERMTRFLNHAERSAEGEVDANIWHELVATDALAADIDAEINGIGSRRRRKHGRL